jgi:leucyl-tRNA---protein transferase
MSLQPFIWDEFMAQGSLLPAQMDQLWAAGWRHFGEKFFRYNLMLSHDEVQTIVPLRLPLTDFRMTKSQRRVWRENTDLQTEFVPAVIDEEVCELFQRHKARFTDNVPEHLRDFLSAEPATLPCQCVAVRCLLEGKLVAVSYLDVGDKSVSSVYGIFEPEHASRSLGIYTMLREIAWAAEQGFTYYYPGYATNGSSNYDYKKRLQSLEGYEWGEGTWSSLPP